ncbi:MAG TPA: hypothetical protein VIL11_04495, partial [Limnochordales bacterium]
AAALMLGVPAPASGGAPVQAWLLPIIDLDAAVAGLEMVVAGRDLGGQLATGVGWSPLTQRWHYRLLNLVDLGVPLRASVGWVDWADGALPGQVHERGVRGELVWEPTLRTRWSLAAFSGQVGSQPGRLATRVSYGQLELQRWLARGWPMQVRLRARYVVGHGEPAGGGPGGSGLFQALSVVVPVELADFRLIGRLGYASGEQALPDLRFQAGGYGDGWLRAYGPGELPGQVLVGLNVEYRRAWLPAEELPVAGQLEMGPFLDVMGLADRQASQDRLSWRTSYGFTAAMPLGGLLVGMDLAWGDQGRFRSGMRLSREF